MKKTQGRYSALKRIAAFLLAFVMVAGYFPTTDVWTASAAEITTDLIATDGVDTVADPQTLTRPATIYGDNTLNAGKVTVGKSVSNSSVTLEDALVNDGDAVIELSDPDNFLVTITQTAQVMGLSSETSVPVDVVFVLDTSGSMQDYDRDANMVEAVNNAVQTLMASNANNRVGVVAFSAKTNQSHAASAEVLSDLAHYEGTAATDHLSLTGSRTPSISGQNGESRTVTGGTNIQAGIALGAQMLTSADTTVQIDGREVTRMPFLIVLSDGSPTFSMTSDTWYSALELTGENGSGNTPYPGNGFMAALTAAYYKGKITEHYYGTSAKEENRCFVYSLGVQLDSLDSDEEDLAELTMNPAAHLNSTANQYADDFRSYWSTYQAGGPVTVTVNGRTTNYQNNPYTDTISANTVAATSNYVNGKNAAGEQMYTGGITYNDGYYNATQTSEIAGIFEDIVSEISKKAISVPTKVTTSDHDFDGYVTFTDPIGEYMEVKDMKGIIANGHFYKGATAAQYLQSGANAEFNALIKEVLEKRMSMTASSGITADAILTAARNSGNQAYYNSATDYDNSIVWWGKTYSTGEEDTGMQVLGAADNDTIDYITSSTTSIPAGADHVCRSYFFYGTAGNTVDNPNHEYLYFVVRVQRSLTAPYQQTVVISAPASLLSMEKVLITESKDENGNTVYTASVEEADPARVVYEVGLRGDITAENVATIVSEEYKAEAPAIDEETGQYTGSVNYDAATDSYSFFTNDWDRSKSTTSHQRAQAKATFDAAADNAFYTYQEDTLIVDDNGNAVTSDPRGKTVYYVREYYDWTGATADAEGNFTAIKDTELIPISIPSDATLVNTDGKWYLPKGAYTGATLVVNGDDTDKTPNATGTATVVAHPERTGDQNNSHYTVLLGNNGKLTLKANTPVPEKTVQVNNTVVDGNGVAVQVGDNLTYSVTVENALDEEATYTITDKVPAGTELVAGSISPGGTEAGGVVTWSVKIPANDSVKVSFTVQVTKEALDTAVVPGTIKNTAVVTFPNGAQYSTNPVENPPYGKTASDASGNDTATQSGYNVGDVITFSIRYHNNETNDKGEYVAANITITDKLPEGTELVAGSISHDGTMADDGTITWNLTNVQPSMTGVVTFQVRITADAVSPVTNSADITVGNNPTIITNTTETQLNKGDLVLTKTVAEGDKNDGTFELTLQESTGKLTGTYTVTDSSIADSVTFDGKGYAVVKIKHNESITIEDLPAGVKITVAELAPDGWTATYDGAATAQQVTIVAGETNKATVNVNNDYHAKPVIFQLKGTKTFVGTNFPAGVTFSFQAVQCNSDGSALTGATPITVYAEVTSPNGVIAFSPREFTEELDRYYKITEAASTVPGLITDSSEYLLHLKVEDNDSGELELTYTLTKNGEIVSSGEKQTGTVTVTGADFTNIYPDPTSITLSGTKTLSGRAMIANEFDFQLIDQATGKGIATAANDADGNFTFAPALNYGTADIGKTYTYYIREDQGVASHVTYDDTFYQLDVTVGRDGAAIVTSYKLTKWTKDATGTYIQSAVLQEGSGSDVTIEGIDFSNKFEIQDTFVNLSGTKHLLGAAADGLKEKEFDFDVYKSDSTGTKGALLVSGYNEAGDGEGADQAAIHFSPIPITVEDITVDGVVQESATLYFLVEEKIPADTAPTFDRNMGYDNSQYLVEVAVTYNKTTGVITASVAGITKNDAAVTKIEFTNYQNPAEVKVQPVGAKTTANAPEGVSFGFTIVNAETGHEAGGGVGAANGDINFETLAFSETGTYYYWIYESNAGNTTNGITYSTARYLMVVTVTRDEHYALDADVAYYEAGTINDSKEGYESYVKEDNEKTPSFHNEYKANGYINLSAKKTFNGTLNAGDFTFKLVRQDNNGEIVGIVSADGTVTFSTMYYSKDDFAEGETTKVIHYVMSEIIPETAALSGVTYDTSKHDVYIKITDNGDGTITAKLVNENGDPAGTDVLDTPVVETGITFSNTYKVQTGDDVTIEIGKNLTGRYLRNEEFNIKLERLVGIDDGQPTWTTVTTEPVMVSGDASHTGTAKFIRYFNADTLSHDVEFPYSVIYRLTEVDSGLGGVEHDTNDYYVEVVITHNIEKAKYEVSSVTYYTDMAADGTLSGDVQSITFNNSYATGDISVTLAGAKALLGDTADSYTFGFEVIETNAAGELMTITSTSGKVSNKIVSTGQTGSITGGEKGGITFGSITYNDDTCAACTEDDNGNHFHYYVIRETVGTASGITYTQDTYYMVVTLHDDGQGNLTAGKTYYKTLADMVSRANAIEESAVLFTNHYGPGTVNLDLQVDKKVLVKYPTPQTFALRGTPVIDPNVQYQLEGSEFDFEVYEADENFEITNTTAVASGTNGSGSGSAVVPFTTIAYTRENMTDAVKNETTGLWEKNFYYVIKELAPSEGSVPGVTIDTKEIYVTVTVTDDGYGNMTATAEYRYDAAGEKVEEPTFTNTYEVKEPTSVILTAVKELTGKDMETFSFQLKDAEGNVLLTKQNDGATVTFDPLTFYLPGTYTYTVSEVIPEGATKNENGTYTLGGMTYDATVYTVTIKVYDDREGELYTVVTISDGTNAVDLMAFENSYDHPDLEIDLSDKINADKTVVGPNGENVDYLLENYTFQFEVIDLQGQKVLGKPDAEGNRSPVVGTSNANGDIIFSEFYFTTAGEYHYLIREIVDDDYADKKITADGQVWCAHIQVVYDRAAGLLKIAEDGVITHNYNADGTSAQVDENPVFVNKYDPKAVEVTVKADKILDGRDLNANEFTFRLMSEDGKTIAAEARNQADGSVTFYLDYELADLAGEASKTFTYTMVEVIPDTKLGGVTYSSESYTVKVKVTDNHAEGKLTATVTSGNGSTFTNQYDAADGTAVIEAVKVLEGMSLSGKVFEFQLLDENNQPIKDADGNPITAKNDADGKVRFQLTMKETGTFTYIIREVKGNIPGVTYDENTYKATVTVTDNLLGQLICTTTYEQGVIPTFVNVYETDGATVTFEATKKLHGSTLVGEDFEFLLLDTDGKVVASGKNAADGKIYLYYTFEEAGEYTFTMVEKAGSDNHIDYDDQVVTVTVTVTDNGEGELVASAPVYGTEDGKAPVFENTYTPDAIKVYVDASKILTGGKTLNAGAFQFQLLDAEGKEIATAKNGADGKIRFELDIAAAGTYTYTMVEKAGTDSHITYDGAKYTVTVKVENNGQGVLVETVTYSTEDGKAPVFKNTWKPEKIGIILNGTKTLTGRDMKAGEFKFQVRDTTGTLVATGTNDAEGKITFTPVGIITKGTYLLTVSEVQGNAEYVTYDKTTFQVKVVVENVDGVLVPKVTGPEGGIVFSNSYDEPANPETGDNTPIFWMIGLLVISALAIVLLVVFRPKKGGKYVR